MKKYHFSDFLLESESSVISELVKHYGRNVVFNTESNFKMSIDELKNIYRILNTSFFNNQLANNLPLYYWNKVEIQNFLKKTNPTIDYSTKNPLGMYSSVVKISNDEYNDVEFIEGYKYTGDEKVTFSDHLLVINSSLIQSQTFIFTVNCICHEMIHYFDDLYGESGEWILLEKMFNHRYDSHTTPTFMSKVFEARKNKMKIISSIDNTMYNFEKLNKEALQLLIEKNQPTTTLIRGKDGKMYVDMSDVDGIGELYPLDNISARRIHLD